MDLVCVKIMRGEPTNRNDERLIRRALEAETQWARQLIVGMCACSLFLRKGNPRRAVLALAKSSDAYRGLERLRRRRNVAEPPAAVADFEQYCRRALGAFEPPVRAGADPVKSVAGLARKLPRRHRSRHRETIDALDALISAGRAATSPDLLGRVVRQLARMLHARVLMRRENGRYVHLEPQSVHTLSTWTLVRIARTQGVRVRGVRPRPEFWRPEQRRPGGVLSFPIGNGMACLARRRPFTAKEAQAVRVVLRILRDRVAATAGRASVAPEEPRIRHASRMKGLIGSSRPWRDVLDQVWRVAPIDCSVLLRGETGTGKELIARALHFNSRRAGGPFVALNCAALSSDTHLSELFGHVRGAFTGAVKSRSGLIRRAHGGTLFLDEVGDMPMETQLALLRVLQERYVRPVGSVRDIRVDVRILAATNRDLDALVASGEFRMDLFHRLAVMEVDLPPLRARIDDLPALAHHILGRLDQGKRLHMDALALLAEHTWPGNVRELENVLHAAALLDEGEVVGPAVVGGILRGRRSARAEACDRRLAPRAAAIMTKLGRDWWSAPSLASDLRVSTRTVNRELAKLMEEGLVERYGEARACRYRRASGAGRDSSGF